MTYTEALADAIDLANLTKREIGIEKLPGIKTAYSTRILPNPENRCGFELRCEIVRPGTPHSTETAAIIAAHEADRRTR